MLTLLPTNATLFQRYTRSKGFSDSVGVCVIVCGDVVGGVGGESRDSSVDPSVLT